MRSGRGVWVWAVLAVVLVAAFAALWPAVINCPLAGGGVLAIWPRGTLARAARWALIPAGLGLALAALRAAARDRVGPDDGRPAAGGALRVIAPLGALTAVAAVLLAADLFPSFVTANALFLGPPVLVAIALSRAFGDFKPERGADDRPVRTVLWLLAGLTLFFAVAGHYMSATVGEHLGDEGHYLIQARSLFEDGDLDIRDNFDGGPLPEKMRSHVHIAPNARDGHWYSYHPFGISLLLAAVWAGGLWARHVLLGAIAAAGCVAMYLLSHHAGAGRRASLTTVLALALSAFWGLYAFRALPETLGATLLAWLFWGVFRQGERPWATVPVAALACAYLPFAHPRFIPLSLLGFGWYGLFGLCGRERWSAKIVRLGVFTVLCAAGYAVYLAVQHRMFDGSAYPISDVLMSYPRGVWDVIADERGLAYVLPLFFWLAGAQVVWIARCPERRTAALVLASVCVVCLLTSCTNTASLGGSCVPGRYVLVVTPLLVPGAAWALDRAPASGRGWFWFLAALSAWMLFLTLALLPQVQRGFIFPIHSLAHPAVFHGYFRGVFNPHSGPLRFQPSGSAALWIPSLYAVALLAGTGVLAAGRRKAGLCLLAAGLALGLAGHMNRPAHRHKSWEPKHVAAVLQNLGRRRLLTASFTRRPFEPPRALLDVSALTVENTPDDTRALGVTTQDLGSRAKGRLVSQPRLEVNDWAGRGLRWTTLADPFAPAAGRLLLRIHGVLTGDARPILCVREGAHTCHEGPVAVAPDGSVAADFSLPIRGRSGHLYILLRLEDGSGTFHLRELTHTPFTGKLLGDANLRLPPGTVIASAAGEP